METILTYIASLRKKNGDINMIKMIKETRYFIFLVFIALESFIKNQFYLSLFETAMVYIRRITRPKDETRIIRKEDPPTLMIGCCGRNMT